MKRLPLPWIVSVATFAAVCAGGEFNPQTATYLGGPGRGEEWNAVDIAPDGMIVVAGTAPDYAGKGVPDYGLMAGGYGIVLRFRPEPFELLSITRLGDFIDDMEVGGADGRIAVAGSFGVAVLSPNGSNIVWRDGAVLPGTKAAQFRNQTPPFKNERYTKRVSRVCIGEDGTVAAIRAEEKVWGDNAPKKGRLYVWNAEGKRLCDVLIADCKYLEDVTIHSKLGMIYVGGFNTFSHDSPHMKNHPIHMPFLRACGYGGEVKWTAYDFTAKQVYDLNTYADSRVQRLQIGRDGFLYMGGYIHGGDYVWKHDPFNVTNRVKTDVGLDSFSVASNMGRGIDQSYFGKYDPETGRPIQTQVLLCRQKPDGGGKPTQIQIRGIHADAAGNVYLAGYCEAFLKQRDAQVVAGKAVAPYHKPEIFLLALTPDFRKRKVWTVFSGPQCEAAAWGLSVRGNQAALIGEVYEGEVITTPGALQAASPAAPVDGYLVHWKTE